eukprot:818737-Prorocentrum_minimum.AAC.1
MPRHSRHALRTTPTRTKVGCALAPQGCSIRRVRIRALSRSRSSRGSHFWGLSDTLGRLQTLSGAFRHFRALSDTFGHFQTLSERGARAKRTPARTRRGRAP